MNLNSMQKFTIMKQLVWGGLVVLTSLTCVLLLFQSLIAQAPFPLPTKVTVKMYLLDAGGVKLPTLELCNQNNSTSYGCTAYSDGTHPYPFNTSSPEVEIDGPAIVDTNNNGDYSDDAVNIYIPQQRYLWDVTAKEYGIHQSSQLNKPLSGVEAQVIAERTFIYQRITDDYWRPLIDNSTDFQAYIPYSYERLLPEVPQQERLMQAMRNRYYMTTTTDDAPIEAMFGADNRAETTQGAQGDSTLIPYRKNVPDPISSKYGCWQGTDDNGNDLYLENAACGTGYGGLSSKGASRWSFGHTSSYGPVALGDPYYPHDSNELGDFWSVRWEDARQILTHYYTNIQLRDATNSQHPALLPANRWVPLQITWDGAASQPTALCLGSLSVLVVAVIQNTGATTWPAGPAFSFSSAEFNGQQVQAADVFAPYPLEAVAPGGTYTATLTFSPRSNVANGTKIYYLFEMYKDSTPFSTLEPGNAWPGYLVPITLVTCTPRAYLPTILADVGVAE